MENKEMQKEEVLKEVTIFDEVYKVENLTARVIQCFMGIQRMQKEFQETAYQAMKAESAVAFQNEQIKAMLAEDKIKPEPKKEEPKKDTKK